MIVPFGLYYMFTLILTGRNINIKEEFVNYRFLLVCFPIPPYKYMHTKYCFTNIKITFIVKGTCMNKLIMNISKEKGSEEPFKLTIKTP